jgi:HK97 gp10 family phage protein
VASVDVTVVFDAAAMHAMLHGPNGDVARDILGRCIRVESRAKWYATGNAGGPRVRTGRLRSSISHQLTMEDGEVTGYVGTNVEYAPFVELGTRRMRARPFLRPALEAAR